MRGPAVDGDVEVHQARVGAAVDHHLVEHDVSLLLLGAVRPHHVRHQPRSQREEKVPFHHVAGTTAQ